MKQVTEEKGAQCEGYGAEDKKSEGKMKERDGFDVKEKVGETVQV